MPRVIHFEINVDEPERAIKFYTDVFGWEMEKWEGADEYWLITTGEESEPGINGGLMRRIAPLATTINTISVPTLDDFMAKVKANGGKIVTAKTAIPGVGYFAYCQDTEGNTFGIIEEDESAR